MRALWLRLLSTYGPADDERHLIPSVIGQLLEIELHREQRGPNHGREQGSGRAKVWGDEGMHQILGLVAERQAGRSGARDVQRNLNRFTNGSAGGLLLPQAIQVFTKGRELELIEQRAFRCGNVVVTYAAQG